MAKLLILGLIIILACKSTSKPIRYYWERPPRDISEQRRERLYVPLKSPHYIPIRNNRISNDLVYKYELMYNKRRYSKYH